MTRRQTFLFSERATIHDVVEAQRKATRKEVEDLSGEAILMRPLDALIDEIVAQFRLTVPVLDRTRTVQLPNEEVDVNVAGDFRRPFLDPNRPYYVKGTAVRVAVPFTGEAVLFKYGSSPFNSPIPAEIRDDDVILTHEAEHPDADAIRKDFEGRLQRIEQTLDMARDVAEEWNRDLPQFVRPQVEQRRAKLERDRDLNLGFPTTAPQTTSDVSKSTRVDSRGKSHGYDLFLSHASEDKDVIARPLHAALVGKGLSVWFDESVLELGDSLRRKIDDGLRHCRYGIVILSPSFFAKQWPQRELDGLIARETASGKKAILPIWHQLDHEKVAAYSLTLADRVAGRSEEGIPVLVQKIIQVITR